MRIFRHATCFVLLLASCGCAHIDFGADRLTYFDPQPHLVVSTTADCVMTATVLVIPGKQRSLKFVSGYGSSELSATLSNGMLQSVGQKTDTKIPETISALASLGAAAGGFRAAGAPLEKRSCDPSITVYEIAGGKPDWDHPKTFFPPPPHR